VSKHFTFCILFLLILGGCIASRGVIERTRTVKEYDRDGELAKLTEESVSVSLPDALKDVSTAVITDTGVSATISGEYEPPVPNVTQEKTVEAGMYLAGIFAIAAVGMLVARFWFPFIPMIAPIACGGAAAAFFMLPTLIDEYSAEIMLIGGGVILWVIYEAWHQRKLQKADPRKLGTLGIGRLFRKRTTPRNKENTGNEQR
jgi:hypothetical protein